MIFYFATNYTNFHELLCGKFKCKPHKMRIEYAQKQLVKIRAIRGSTQKPVEKHKIFCID
jgi:hypothetical protein